MGVHVTMRKATFMERFGLALGGGAVLAAILGQAAFIAWVAGIV